MYINLKTLRVVSLSQIRRDNPNFVIPSNPSDELLAKMGYARVQRTPQPEGDAVAQGQPEEREGQWYQTWITRDYTGEELAEQLVQAKEQKRNSLDNDRDAAFAAGMPYTLSGEEDVVQTRPQDQINLMGLASKAQRAIAAGDDSPMPFRGLSNETRMLTPAAMDAMAMAALGHIEGIYARSWARKDAVDNADTLEAVEAISW